MAGDEVSDYHVQAAIAATHARAAEARSTDWPLILSLYDQLLAINASPVVALNRAVAVAKVHGAAEALDGIERWRMIRSCAITICSWRCAGICCWSWAGARKRRVLSRGAGVRVLGAGAAVLEEEAGGVRGVALGANGKRQKAKGKSERQAREMFAF